MKGKKEEEEKAAAERFEGFKEQRIPLSPENISRELRS